MLNGSHLRMQSISRTKSAQPSSKTSSDMSPCLQHEHVGHGRLPCDTCHQARLARITMSKTPTARAFIPEEWGYTEDTPLQRMTHDFGGCVQLVCPVHATYPQCEDCGDRVRIAGSAVIAVDGACPNNGQRKENIVSGVGVYVGKDSEFNRGFPLVTRGATNQKAELQAAIKGLEVASSPQFQDLQRDETSTLTIKTDSNYVYKGTTSWIFKWKINGWKSAAKNDVANKDLWEKLD